MYQLNYFRNRSESGIGFQSQTVSTSYTWIGIIYGMLCYLLDKSIKCYEVVDISNAKIVLNWSRE